MATIGIVGAGGDGVVSAAEILLKSASKEGYYGRLTKIYDAVIKGGGSAARLSLDLKKISGFSGLDILIVLDWDKYAEFAADFETNANTLIVSEKIAPSALTLAGKKFPPVQFSEIVKTQVGEKKAKNLLIAGFLSAVLGLSGESVKKVIAKKFAKKPEMLEKNLAAFEIGVNLKAPSEVAAGFVLDCVTYGVRLEKISNPKPKIIIHGNEAITLGAIKAGCRFFSGYPITPASEILESMRDKLPKIGGTFIQAEDEIAALAMALGASFAGEKAMTATSGPGFSLMSEMQGLGINCEIPVVIVNVQRGGPCTGMPTKSEQSDLNHAVFGGHGDGPRVVLAPRDLERCYDLTVEAFNIAEECQTPVILLSDQTLAQTTESVDDFTGKEIAVKERLKPSEEELKDYKRHRLTESGISPMAIPGTPGGQYQARGLTHTETAGPASASYGWQKKMHDKLNKKLSPLVGRTDLVKTLGEKNERVGIIFWGSSLEAALELRRKLAGSGISAKILVPEIVSPFPKEAVEKFLGSVEILFVVEMNHGGQLANLLKIHCWKSLPDDFHQINQVGGKMFEIGKETLKKYKNILNGFSGGELVSPWFNP